VISRRMVAPLVLGAGLLTAACGGGSQPTTTPSPGGSGSIYVSGSSTVEPVSLAVSEAFRAQHPEFGYTVEGPGTGDGFAKFCADETDVADASRAIRQEEVELCAQNGVEWVELLIGNDGLTVMTHPDTPIECLTFADLYALFGPESDNIATWQDAGALAAELGSTTQFPADLPLQITAPGEESGTYDAFVELALADIIEERGADEFLRVPGPNYTASANDNVIVEGVEAGPGSLGFVGYAYFAEAGDSVKAIAIDGGSGCVRPSPETVADGTYPISRPLYIYVNTTRAAENPLLADWVDFYLSDEGIAMVSQEGYVALPPAELERTRAAWADR
jgi:phosphate transport system substrate-binding protein